MNDNDPKLECPEMAYVLITERLTVFGPNAFPLKWRQDWAEFLVGELWEHGLKIVEVKDGQ